MKQLLQLLMIPTLFIQNALLRKRLRRAGVEPDSLPEIQELRRRYECGEPLHDHQDPKSNPGAAD